MDYIQEELRRQREALAAVLLGGGARQTPEDGQEAVRLLAGALSAVRSAAAEQTAAEPAPGFAIARRPRFAAEGGIAGEYGIYAEASAPAAPGGGLPGAGAVSPGEAAAAPASEDGEDPSAALRELGREALSPAETEALGDMRAAAETITPPARRSRGTPAAERTVTELVYPAGGGAAVAAEALSRAFQRDARRYDGGFTPY